MKTNATILKTSMYKRWNQRWNLWKFNFVTKYCTFCCRLLNSLLSKTPRCSRLVFQLSQVWQSLYKMSCVLLVLSPDVFSSTLMPLQQIQEVKSKFFQLVQSTTARTRVKVAPKSLWRGCEMFCLLDKIDERVDITVGNQHRQSYKIDHLRHNDIERDVYNK